MKVTLKRETDLRRDRSQLKIIYALTHPIQYQAPLIRFLVSNGIDLEVAYATDITAHGYRDAGFGRDVQWDVPLLDGYPYEVLDRNAEIPHGFRSLPRYYSKLRRHFRVSKSKVVWVHGWGNPYALAAILAARSLSLPILMRGETHLGCLHGTGPRRWLHRLCLRRIFRLVHQFLAVGTANKEFYKAYGVPTEKIHLTPYAVDNERFRLPSSEALLASHRVRERLDIAPDRPIVLFSGKLIAVKDAATLIRAIGQVRGSNPILLLAGDGELRATLETLAKCEADGRVQFLGFQNQTALPELYAACDLFVLPSTFEPWGLVINEVMNAAKPIIASDHVGAAHDLITPGDNGDIFRAGDVEQLTDKLTHWLSSSTGMTNGGRLSLSRISQWGFREVLTGLNSALSCIPK